MNQEINKILSELYQIDESLRKHEKELLEIINEFLANKPDAQFDDEFRGHLKAEILNRIELMRHEHDEQAMPVSSGDGIKFALPFPSRLSYSLAGAFLMLLLAMPFAYYGFRQEGGSQNTVDLRFGSGIEKLAGGAFGDLSSKQVEDGGFASADAPQVMGLGGEGAQMESAKIGMPFMPDLIKYEYAYVGEEFALSGKEIDVLRRKKDSGAGRAYSDAIKSAKIDLIDTANFQNTGLSNLNIVEDREFGYNLYLDFRENTVSIFSNWEKWPNPEQNCGSDMACYERLRLKESDVPADGEIIALADAFAREYGIDLSGYGPGEVQNHWRRYHDLMRAEGGASEIYIPDEIAVLYPLLLEDLNVYENGGEKSGLHVNVNIRHRKASGVHSLSALNYESSAYEAISDAEKVLALAREGGISYQYYYAEALKTVRVELDTPQIAWLKYYSYNNEKRSSEELFIPAMIFPIRNLSEMDSNFYQKNIIVPLAREIYDQYQRDKDGPRILPIEAMPYIEENDAQIISDQENTSDGKEEAAEPEIINDDLVAEPELNAEEEQNSGIPATILPESDMPMIQIED